jgi:hypothetical protein
MAGVMTQFRVLRSIARDDRSQNRAWATFVACAPSRCHMVHSVIILPSMHKSLQCHVIIRQATIELPRSLANT